MSEMLQKQTMFIRLLLGSLVIGVLFDYFFYGKALGLSYPLFVIAFYGVVFGFFRERLVWRWSMEWFLLLPILLLSLTFVLFDNDFLHILNFLGIPLLIVVQTMLMTGRNRGAWYRIGFISEVLEMLLFYTVKHIAVPFRMLREWIKARTDTQKYGVLVKVLIGLLISLPLLILVVSLLAEADSIFSHFINEIPRMLFDLGSGETIFRLILILMITVGMFSYLWTLLIPPGQSLVPDQQTEQPEEEKGWDGVISVTVLSIVNVIYVMFTVIQISYLFGGAESILPSDVTYAEYARRGFSELVFVTLINFLILISTLVFVSKRQPAVYATVKIMLSVLTVCTGFMLFSAYFRLALYEEAYGYTESRLLAHGFMIFLLVLFLIALAKIWRSAISLWKCYIVVGLVSYVILNYVNMDRMIARNNIDRFVATGKIDLDYLTSLSDDAVPEMTRLLSDKGVGKRINERLEQRKLSYDVIEPWQSFNLARYRSKQVLSELKIE